MEYILIAVIVLQWAYIIYKEESIKKEREKLQLKLMSKDITEYKEVTEPPIKPVKKGKYPKISEFFLAKEYRKPKRKKKKLEESLTFIQKRRFRIRTPGELREITYKGIRAQRRKSGKAWWQ